MAELLQWTAGRGISPKVFSKKTIGWGTTAERNAITRWVVGGFFLDTDLKAFYQNTGTEIAVVWNQSVTDDIEFSGLIFALS